MLQKNTDKQNRKLKRDTWQGYFPRVTQDRTKYNRKNKHKNLLLSCIFKLLII